MLKALWVVLLGMAALFIVQGVVYLSMTLLKRLFRAEKNQEEKG